MTHTFRIVLCTVVLLFGSLSVSALPLLAEEPDTEGYESLLKDDLTNWTTKGNWSLERPGLVSLEPREGEKGWQRYTSYLWANKQYGDFVLSLEYKIPKKGNSGIYVRVKDPDDPVTTGIEVQILDSHGKKEPLTAHDCGGIIGTVGPSKNMAKPADEWNKMIVTCRGFHMEVELNGHKIIDLALDKSPMKDRPMKGHFGLQDHGQSLQFRNVFIKELESN